MHQQTIRRLTAVSLATLMAAGTTLAQAQQQQVQARVVTTSPVTLPNGSISYNVTYEYAGRQYNTRTSTPPGASIMVNAGDYGVATTSPVAPQPQLAAAPVDYQPNNGMQGNPQDFPNVVPEQGVVVSGGGAAPVFAAPAPVYAQAAPVYVQPAPVYYPAPAYYPGYAVAPYAYPPIGISLGFGYSRGWGGGGYYGRGWR